MAIIFLPFCIFTPAASYNSLIESVYFFFFQFLSTQTLWFHLIFRYKRNSLRKSNNNTIIFQLTLSFRANQNVYASFTSNQICMQFNLFLSVSSCCIMGMRICNEYTEFSMKNLTPQNPSQRISEFQLN